MNYFEALAEERHIRLSFAVSGNILADTDLLQRAVANLLSNAISHVDHHSENRLEALHLSNVVRINETNQGDNIPLGFHERMIDRFWRADSSRHTSGSSSGLGLSIVPGIMNLHEGAYGVKSEERLTIFWLFFLH